jgi:PAS domain S-box-containing protein
VLGVQRPERNVLDWNDVMVIEIADGESAATMHNAELYAPVQREPAERKRAEEALPRSQHFAQRVLDTTPDCLYIYDLVAQRSVHVNRGIAEILGYTAEQIQEMGPAFFPTLLHPDDSPRVTEHHARFATARDDEVLEIEYRMKHRDGEWRWLHSRDVLFSRTANGLAKEILGTARDITRHKQAEERILGQSPVLEAINEVLLETLACQTDEEVARMCLAVAEELTDSKFGFVGEANEAGHLDTIALSDPGWDACTIPESKALVMIRGMEVQGIWGRVLEDEQPLLINDPASHPDWVGTPAGHPPLTAFLGVPLKHAGKTIGLLALANKEAGYELADQQAIEALSVGLVAALHRKRAEEQIRHNATRTEALARIASRLNAQLDLQTVLNAVCEESACALNVPVTSVYLYDRQHGLLSFAGGFGLPPDWGEHVPPVPPALYDPFPRHMESLILIPDVRGIPGLPGADLFAKVDIRSQVSAIMIREDQLVGTLNVNTLGQTRHFTADELALLVGLADQAAQAIENARLFQETQQRWRELVLLFETSTAVSSSLEVDTVVQAIVRQVAAAAAAEGCALSLWDREQNALVTLLDYATRADGLKPEAPGTVYLLGDHPTSYQVLTKRQLLVVQASDPHADQAKADWMIERRVASLLMVPLVVRDESIGLLEVMQSAKRGQREFTSTEIMLCQLLANQAAAALANARLFEETKRRAEQLATLHRIGLSMTSAFDLDERLDALYQEIARVMDVGVFSVALHDEETGRIDFPLLTSMDGPMQIEPLDIDLRPGLAGYIIQSRQPLYLPDSQAVPDGAPYRPIRLKDPPTRSYVGIPLTVRGRTIGALSVQSFEPQAYTEDDLELLTTIGAQASVAIENARLYWTEQRRAREAAAVGAITQALNATADLGSVFEVVARQLGRLSDFDGLSLALLSDDHQRFTLYDLTGEQDALLKPGEVVSVEVTAVTADVLAGRPHVTPDLSTELDYPADRALYEAGLRSRLSLPLMLGEQVMGALNLGSRRLNAFSPDRFSALVQVAAAVAAAVQNARLYEETCRRNRELALLNRVISASTSSGDTDSLLAIVCRELALALDVPRAAAALYDDEKTKAVVVAEYVSRGQAPALGEVILGVGNPASQHLLQHKTPLVIQDAGTDPGQAPVHDLLRRRGAVSLLLLPLVVEGEVVGALGVCAIEPRRFSAQEVALAERVARQVSSVLSRARLWETQQRLSTAIDQAAESVVITDSDGTIVYVNPAFERITGYDRSEAVGEHFRLLSSSQHDAAHYRDIWLALLAGEVWQGRMINQKKAGDLCTMEATITPVRSRTGDVVNYVATMRDVTREVELKEHFRQAQKMEALGRLAGGVAHDFNNLLTVIHLSTRLLERDLDPRDSLGVHVQRIREAARRATNLTGQLLSFSRREVSEPRVLNLNQVVGGTEKMLRRIIGEDIELLTVLAEDLWLVEIDPTQVDQVVMNLAVNARDAMPEGGTLTIETANVALNDAYVTRHMDTEPGEYVMLAVTDTGVGMDEEVKAHIFEPFFTTKERGKGTGLGLATVFGIVKQNEGNLWVYSKPGQGTTFKIYLPRTEAGQAKEPLCTTPVRTTRGTETLLVAEDEADVRVLTQQVLKAHGYRVLAAGDGAEALRVSEQHDGPIHLLLTDLVMPQMSGLDLAQRLRSRRPEMQVLFMSGYADRPLVRQIVADPGATFLPKPFTGQSLTEKVRAVLESRTRTHTPSASG